MVKKPRRPLLRVCLTLSSFALVSYSVAFVLPFWVAKYPRSKNRFLHLGLWEICLENFMPETLGNLMYSGCFYLYDPQITPLRPSIFRTWFVVCQLFFTLAFITNLVSEVTVLTQSFNLFSPRGPRAVLFLFLSSGFTALFLLIGLTVMGAAVDSEIRRRSTSQQGWLQGLDESGISWSFGLATISLIGNVLTLVILGWFVYPKRVPHGLLLANAWDWPTRDDWLCRKHVADMRATTGRSQSGQLCSSYSGDLVSQSILTGGNLIPTGSDYSSRRSGYSTSLLTPQTYSSCMVTKPASSLLTENGNRSNYDPRSPDTISLLSYGSPRVANPVHPPGTITALVSAVDGSHLSKRVGQSNTGDTGSIGLTPPVPQPLPESRPILSQTKSLRSLDTSVWSSPSTSVQAARPMRPGRSSNKRRVKKLRAPDNTLHPTLVEESSSELTPTSVPVQAAKKMRRLH